MNWLAHTFLSNRHPGLLTGNFLGDFVKGKQYLTLPKDIQKGILLHRKIDFYTDHHQVFKQTTARLKPASGRYASVAADLLYDHLLAKNWHKYSPFPLKTFTGFVYKTLQHHSYLMPPVAAYVTEQMAKYDWLSQYAHEDGLKKALEGVQRRAKYECNLVASLAAYQQQPEAFEHDFKTFMPDMQTFTAQWRIENNYGNS